MGLHGISSSVCNLIFVRRDGVCIILCNCRDNTNNSNKHGKKQKCELLELFCIVRQLYVFCGFVLLYNVAK